MKNLVVVMVCLSMLVIASCRRGEQSASGTAGHGTARGGSEPAATATGIEVGSLMPEYSAMWLDGSKFELASRRQNVVLLNVWATWCGPCRHEIPELQRLHDQYKEKNFEVVGVSVDESGVEPVRQFVDEQKMTYPIALDPEGKLANVLQTSVLPTTVLLDRDGKIVWKRYGLILPNDKELKGAIEKAL